MELLQFTQPEGHIELVAQPEKLDLTRTLLLFPKGTFELCSGVDASINGFFIGTYILEERKIHLHYTLSRGQCGRPDLPLNIQKTISVRVRRSRRTHFNGLFNTESHHVITFSDSPFHLRLKERNDRLPHLKWYKVFGDDRVFYADLRETPCDAEYERSTQPETE